MSVFLLCKAQCTVRLDVTIKMSLVGFELPRHKNIFFVFLFVKKKEKCVCYYFNITKKGRQNNERREVLGK